MDVEEKLAISNTDKLRIKIIEQFLITQLKDKKTDKLIVKAVKIIYQSNGTVRIKELSENCISVKALLKNGLEKWLVRQLKNLLLLFGSM